MTQKGFDHKKAEAAFEKLVQQTPLNKLYKLLEQWEDARDRFKVDKDKHDHKELSLVQYLIKTGNLRFVNHMLNILKSLNNPATYSDDFDRAAKMFDFVNKVYNDIFSITLNTVCSIGFS